VYIWAPVAPKHKVLWTCYLHQIKSSSSGRRRKAIVYLYNSISYQSRRLGDSKSLGWQPL